MNRLAEDLNGINLFYSIEPKEIDTLLTCLDTKCVHYSKGDYIIEEGNKVYDFGILLSGHARAIKWDPSGHLVIISLLHKGSEIGIILAASLEHTSPVTVEALDEVSILRIPFEHVFTKCKNTCPLHDQLLRNYINIVAQKGLVLHERINCLLRPTIREKVLTYLRHIAREQHSDTLILPINRNAMAEYLNVERSALSRELSHMKHDGIITYHKNIFTLLNTHH